MNSRGPTAGMQSTVRDRVNGWRELLDECGRKPTRGRVHALRVMTLRIQAELEHEVAELPRASHQAQAMFRFLKLGEKLRRALGKVREFDVWVGKLEKLRTSLTESTQYVPRSTQECIRQIERLEVGLRKKRWSEGEKLVAVIAKRRGGLISASEAASEATGDHAHESEGSDARTVLREFARIAAEFPEFTEANLHDFRKRIKKVRYLAGIHADDATCAQIAAQLKKAQAAIGEWHDWQLLARTASQGRKYADLAELLESMTTEAFDAAVATCRAVSARLIGQFKNGLSESRGILRKAPGRSEDLEMAARRFA